MPLTDTAIRKTKPGAVPLKLRDGGGLYLLMRPDGARWWRWDYRRPVTGKRNTLSLGTYPDTGLADAREKRDAARKLLAAGVDPGEQRKQAKQERAALVDAAGETFEVVAREWMARQTVARVTAEKNRWLLETFLFPEIGSRPIGEITPRELLDALRKIEATGKLETAARAKIKAGQVFRYAMLEGKAEIDPTASLRGALKAAKARHHAAVTEPAKIGQLLRAIEGFSGQPVTHAALKLAPLVFVRPGELRAAEWAEIDLDAAMWRIRPERMKMKAAHLVPLSSQAVAILRDLHALTGGGHHVFPGLRPNRPMSENTVNAALRALGYSGDEMTGHGFRSMAATRLNELGWNADAVERQLAHAETNKVREAYTHAAQYLHERVRMMQAWADYLDGLRSVGNVVPLRAKAG
ncbi:tyrosine-type recombinase/integrase [Xanthomonas perforans]|uniref:Phage-related integrase n=5 Tax=Xanthomonas euvesicatoria TaxID=456327 RepID=Q3BTG5_XANE5|nr:MULTISPECIES: integrase arm-type DNA-binding domain-containing protein [Xanthomonas]WVK02388.1 integrase arm-type DNA-binding domain-containing protein [Xanthomonas campestris pv. olitorii]AJC44806.1 integrase [Xanthomonas sacchari]AOY65779.1 integrase [Xanthomonas euvesicatoria pv. vesicatoria str. 85-10]APO90546.1 integrase [Xanthomonas euvesicatoria]KAB7774606.1 integrase [Xanthomonas sp. LMG 12459]